MGKKYFIKKKFSFKMNIKNRKYNDADFFSGGACKKIVKEKKDSTDGFPI